MKVHLKSLHELCSAVKSTWTRISKENGFQRLVEPVPEEKGAKYYYCIVFLIKCLVSACHARYMARGIFFFLIWKIFTYFS